MSFRKVLFRHRDDLSLQLSLGIEPHQLHYVIHDTSRIGLHQLVIPEELPVCIAVELSPVSPVCDAERGEDISHLLEVEEDVHCGLDPAVLVAADEDPCDFPLGEPRFLQVIQVLQAGRPVEKDLQAG